MRFVDTNVAVYAILTDPGDERKQRTAQVLLNREGGNLAVSIQVLGEFYTQVTRPSRPYHLSHQEALMALESLLRYHVQPLTVETFNVALQYRQRFGLNYWDCLILAAAKQSGCDAVYSEDMSTGQDYDGIRVIHPFEPVGEPVPA